MRKYFWAIAAAFILIASPAVAATKPAVWKPATPEGYTPITWAKANGIASFFRAPENSGATDFITRIYLPQNQIKFLLSSTTPIDLGPTETGFIANVDDASSTSYAAASNISNLSFERITGETAKQIDPNVKFLWDAPFFNMKNGSSDLSMALKYTIGTTTTITSGSRSIPDLAEPRRMLIINNQTGKALIQDFDANTFIDPKLGDQAIEGFSPTVAKSDNSSAAASRLFVGVSDNGQELIIYCSRLATISEASEALEAAGVSPEHQLQLDGGGSTSCGYNLPGQYFVEPMRTLPVLMGAVSIVATGKVVNNTANVRNQPSTKGKIVTTLKKGTEVRAFEEKNGWYRIGDGQWIMKSLIK